MPHGRSKRKTLRKNEAQRAKNRTERAALRTEIKKAKAAVEESSETTAEQVKRTVSVIDRAAQKNLIHPKRAARIKSQLAKAIQSPAAES